MSVTVSENPKVKPVIAKLAELQRQRNAAIDELKAALNICTEAATALACKIDEYNAKPGHLREPAILIVRKAPK